MLNLTSEEIQSILNMVNAVMIPVKNVKEVAVILGKLEDEIKELSTPKVIDTPEAAKEVKPKA